MKNETLTLPVVVTIKKVGDCVYYLNATGFNSPLIGRIEFEKKRNCFGTVPRGIPMK